MTKRPIQNELLFKPAAKGIYITDIYKTQLSVGGVIVRIDTNKGISGYGECLDIDENASTELSGLGITPNAAAMSAHGVSAWTRVS